MNENTITQAADNIFLDLGFSAQEADNLLIRSATNARPAKSD
jgi:hypothetical protein